MQMNMSTLFQSKRKAQCKCMTDVRHHPDNFCYLCTKIFGPTDKKLPLKSANPKVNSVYHDLFTRCYKSGVDSKNKQKLVLFGLYSNHAPSFICSTCYSRMLRFDQDQSTSLGIEVPPIWNKMKLDHSDCFFGRYTLGRYSKPPTSSSVIMPVTNIESPGRKRKADHLSPACSSSSSSSRSAKKPQTSDDSFHLSPKKREFIKFNQKSLNNFIRRLRLGKSEAVCLASELYNRNGLERGKSLISKLDLSA